MGAHAGMYLHAQVVQVIHVVLVILTTITIFFVCVF